MNTKAKLFTGAIALALAATSTVLTASNASARPYDYDRDDGHHDRAAWWNRDHNDRGFRFNNRDDYRYNNRRNVYIYRPSQRYRTYDRDSNVVRLPEGCRRVVYRDRTYYTRDNYEYYTYDSGRQGFIVVNFPGVRIGF
jgi:hypothetical protein